MGSAFCAAPSARPVDVAHNDHGLLKKGARDRPSEAGRAARLAAAPYRGESWGIRAVMSRVGHATVVTSRRAAGGADRERHGPLDHRLASGRDHVPSRRPSPLRDGVGRGSIVLVFVGVPAIRATEGEARAAAMRALGRRWRPLGWSSMGIAVLSGSLAEHRHGAFRSAALDSRFDRWLMVKSVWWSCSSRARSSTTSCSGRVSSASSRRAAPRAPATRRRARRRRLVQLRSHLRRSHRRCRPAFLLRLRWTRAP